METFFSNPLDKLAGALVWPVLVALFYGIVYGFRRVFTKYPLEGNWFAYHYTTSEGRVQLVEREYLIRKGIRHKYCGEIWYEAPGEARKKRYRFSVREERGTFLFSAKSLVKAETFQVRSKGIFDEHQPVYGVLVGINFDSEVYAGIQILTKRKLTGDEIANVIDRSYKIDSGRPMITVGARGLERIA